MKVVRVIPRDIVILTEFTFSDLKLLKLGLEATELNLDTTNDYQARVEDYMTNKLYKQVSELVDELNGENVGTDT